MTIHYELKGRQEVCFKAKNRADRFSCQ